MSNTQNNQNNNNQGHHQGYSQAGATSSAYYNQDYTSVVDSLKYKYKNKVNKLRSSNEDDPITKRLGLSADDPEAHQWREVVKEAKEMHSIRNIRVIVRWLGIVGWVASILTVLVAMWGVELDFSNQFKESYATWGDGVRYSIAFFIAVIIIGGGHLFSIGWFNKDNSIKAKMVLITLFFLFVGAGLYFESRAVTYMTKANQEDKKAEALKDGSYTNSIIAQRLQKQIDGLERQKKQLEESIAQFQMDLQSIQNSKTLNQDVIDTYNSRKRHPRAETRNFYNAMNQIKKLEVREKGKLEVIERYQNEVSKIDEKIAMKTIALKKELKELDSEFKKNAHNDYLLIFGFIVILEVASYGKLLGNFLLHVNAVKMGVDEWDKIESEINTLEAMLGKMRGAKRRLYSFYGDQMEATNQELEVLRYRSEIDTQVALNQMSQQAETYGRIQHQMSELADIATKQIGDSVALAIEKKKREAYERQFRGWIDGEEVYR
jgi:hypothetical protein